MTDGKKTGNRPATFVWFKRGWDYARENADSPQKEYKHACPEFGQYHCGCDEGTPGVISEGCQQMARKSAFESWMLESAEHVAWRKDAVFALYSGKWLPVENEWQGFKAGWEARANG